MQLNFIDHAITAIYPRNLTPQLGLPISYTLQFKGCNLIRVLSQLVATLFYFETLHNEVWPEDNKTGKILQIFTNSAIQILSTYDATVCI